MDEQQHQEQHYQRVRQYFAECHPGVDPETATDEELTKASEGFPDWVFRHHGGDLLDQALAERDAEEGREFKAAPLPVIDCEGCGLCCTHMGSPPGFAAARLHPGAEDYTLWLALPGELRQELTDYYTSVERGESIDRAAERLPCLWYDDATRKCRHHEFRPFVCRDLRVGGYSCLRIRDNHKDQLAPRHRAT